MRAITSLVCILSLSLSPVSLETESNRAIDLQYQSVEAEPLTLTLIGIAVGLAGIATDVYGMTQNNDISVQVAEQVNQVTVNQIKLGLSPLKEINPKLKQLVSGQDRLLANQELIKNNQAALQRGQVALQKGQQTIIKNQAILREGQEKILRGQDELKRGQETLRSGQLALSEQLVLVAAEQASLRAGERLMKALRRENQHMHKQTQSSSSVSKRRGTAPRFGSSTSRARRPDAAKASAEPGSTRRSPPSSRGQAFFGEQSRAGKFVSREYRALIHLSLATCLEIICQRRGYARSPLS